MMQSPNARRRTMLIVAMICCVVFSEIISQKAIHDTYRQYAFDSAHRQERYSIIYTNAFGEIESHSVPGGSEKHIPIRYSTNSGGCYLSVYSRQAKNSVVRVTNDTYLLGLLFVAGGSHSAGGPCKPNVPEENLRNTAAALFHADGRSIRFDGSPGRWLTSGIQSPRR